MGPEEIAADPHPEAAEPAHTDPGVVPGEVRLAALVMAAQAVGLLVAGVVLVAKTLAGGADSLGRAASDTAFALGGALLLLAAARAVRRLRVAVRTPVLVLEFLALPVGYSLGVQGGRIGYGGPILVSALAVLYLLFTPPARRVLER